MTPSQNNVIYHNPRCSKSRATLNLLHDQGIELKVIEYLQTPPSVAELGTLCEKLGVQPLALCRTKEARFKELGLRPDDDRPVAEWLQLMVDNPILIERPIVVYKNRVALGRPPENVLSILDSPAD